MLAIIFGLATDDQARLLLNYARRYCWTGWTLATNYPLYPWWRIPLHHYAVGMPDYHNGLRWLQPGILYVIALHKSRRKQEAKSALTAIASKIVQHGGVYEVYEQNGNPVRRITYRSEHPFAWSAGLYLWAYRQIFDT